MTEKDIRKMYENVSLSEEKLAELEKKLLKRFENKDGALDDDLIRLSQIGEKPRKNSRRKYIISACSAAAAVVIMASVITLAYNSGMFVKIGTVSDDTSQQTSVSTPDTNTSLLNPNDFIITKELLPEYPNKGVYDVAGGANRVDETAFYDKCADDLANKTIGSTVIIAELTIDTCTADAENDVTVYDATIGRTYYSTLGINTEGRSIKLTLDGCDGGTIYSGCPPYYEGDRIIAALRYTKTGYTLSAAYTLADIITVNGTDFAAVRSSQLSNLFIKNYANGDTIEYTTTMILNPVTYYAVYEMNEYGSYLTSKKESTETEVKLEGSFDPAALDFRHDSNAMKLLDEAFCGYWRDLAIGYFSDDNMFGQNNDTFFGGVAEDKNAFYLKRRVRGSDSYYIYAVIKDNPDTVYLYQTDGSSAVPFSEYSERFFFVAGMNFLARQDDFSGTPSTANGAVACNQFGMAKVIAGYNDDDLYDMFFDLLENGSTECYGKTWKRAVGGYKSLGYRSESIFLNAAEPDRLVVSIRMYDAAAAEHIPDIGEEFNIEDSARYFRAEFTKQDGKFSYTLTPCSGETTDPEHFFSPLESTENYPVTAASAPGIDGITVNYYPVQRDGMTEIYAVRRLGTDPDSICEIYYRDPACDEYIHICDGYAPTLLTTFDGTVYCFTSGEMNSYISRVVGGNVVASSSINRLSSAGAGLYESGLYLIIKADNNWAVLDKQSLDHAEFYGENELYFTNDGFVTVKDGKQTLHDEAGQDFDGALLSLYSRYKFTWKSLTTKTMNVTGKSEEYDTGTEWGTLCEPADPEWRTRALLLNSLKETYTDKAAEEALDTILADGAAMVEQGYRLYTKKTENFTILNGDSTLESAELSADGNSAVLNFKMEYKCLTYSYGDEKYSTNSEYYSINAIKTENGWRLDSFYSPVSDSDFSKCT